MTPTEQLSPCPFSHCTNSSLLPHEGPYSLIHLHTRSLLLHHKCKMTPKTYTYKYTHKSLLSTVRMYTSPHTIAHNYWDHMYTGTPLYTWIQSIHMYTTVHMKPIYTQIHKHSSCRATYTNGRIILLCTPLYTQSQLYTYTHTQWLPGYLHKKCRILLFCTKNQKYTSCTYTLPHLLSMLRNPQPYEHLS